MGEVSRGERVAGISCALPRADGNSNCRSPAARSSIPGAAKVLELASDVSDLLDVGEVRRAWRRTTSKTRSANSSSRCSPRSSVTSTPRREISKRRFSALRKRRSGFVGAKEIATASEDLSHRTEEQAASLEETSGRVDAVTETVKKTAEGSARARTVVGRGAWQRREGGRGGAPARSRRWGASRGPQSRSVRSSA